jgi:hypothetical protein
VAVSSLSYWLRNPLDLFHARRRENRYFQQVSVSVTEAIMHAGVAAKWVDGISQTLSAAGFG